MIRSRLLAAFSRFALSPLGKASLALALIAGAASFAFFGHYWFKYSRVVDAKLAAGPFNHASRVLAAPEAVFVGQEMTPDGALLRLREAGYSDSRHNPVGTYKVKDNAVEIYPGPLSYFSQEPAVLYFADNGTLSRIVSLNDNTPQPAYELEPALVTNLFDDERSKRRLYKFEDYPEHLVKAILAIEDHRFFSHYGVDVIRTTKAAIDGLLEWRQPRGTSTLTQQLALNFFLTREISLQRKLAELLIALNLERRLTKEQIFEYYANQIFMGRSGSFNVMGMGEAARAYFDKDVRDVTLAEAALLAGLPQGPSKLNPYRHPDRAIHRRDQVLQAMLRRGYIGRETYQEATNAELALARGHVESSAAPYYVDLVNAHLREHFDADDLITENYWVYTTLDQQLQAAAVEAVRAGMEEVDKKIANQRRFRGKEPPRAQAALVALDPRTGEVKAIVGGRDYGESQLNRVLAKRQPGSIFKPFVFAAAIDTALDQERMERALDGGARAAAPMQLALYTPGEVFTASSLIDDVPTTFWYDKKPYEPSNHLNKIYGLISMREAMRRSVNIATVKIAEQVGYDRVTDLARRAGMGDDVQPTPAIALGAYEASPLQIAGAYTVFANHGRHQKPYFVREVRDAEGRVLHRNRPHESELLDPRVAYIVTHMLEDVVLRGTGARVRFGHDFTEPAAGKTGTDDDGWFAGFTNNLLCIAWVGFDDNSDLRLEGAHSALPIWAEFMKRAHALRAYRNPGPFEAPDGVVQVEIDADTMELATSGCANRSIEVFVSGTQPFRFCRLHGGGSHGLATNVAGWQSEEAEEEPGAETPLEKAQEAASPSPVRIATPAGMTARPAPDPAEAASAEAETETGRQPEQEEPERKKSGFFGKIFGVFKK